MQMGFAVPLAGSWATPANQVELAQRAEELGYASLWTFQRLLFPTDREGPDAARWQPVYRSVHDPLITLAYLAAHTTRIRLGVAVLNMPWFSPILLAKQTATLDAVSGGRLDLGLGLGWSKQEYDAAGAPFERRGARAEEFVACLKAIWTEDPVDFSGEFHQVARRARRPQAGPAARIRRCSSGGSAEAALRRAGRVADGWISSSGQDLAAIGTAIRVVADAAAEAGRDPATLRFVSRGVVRLRPEKTGERRPLTGSLEQIKADVAEVAEQGVTELFVDLNFDGEIGAVDADPAASMARAHELLDALAPS